MEEKAQQLRVAEKIVFWKEADYLHGNLEKQQKFEEISALEKAAEEKYKNLLLEKEKVSLTDLSEEKAELLKKNSLLSEVIVFEFASDSLLASQETIVNEKEEKLLLTMQALLSQDMLLSQGENEMEREQILSLLTSLSSDTENFSSIISAFLYEKMLSDSCLNETAYAGNELNGIGDIAGFYHPRESYLGFRRNYLKAQYEKVNASTDLKENYEKFKSYSNKLNSTYSNLLEDWAVKELTSVCLESLYSQMDNEIQVRKGVIAGLSVALVGNVALALINPFAISGVTSLTASIAVEEGVIKKIEDYKTQLSGFYSNRILRVEEAGEEKDQPLNQYILALEELTEAEKELARLKGNSSSGNALTLEDFTEGLKEKLYLTCFDEDSVSSVGNDFTYLTKKGKSFYSLSEALSSIKDLRSQNLQLAFNSIPSDADEIFVSMIEGQLDWKYANLSQPLTNVEQIVNLSLTPLWEKAQMVYSLREKELSLLLENFSNQKQELDSQFARMRKIAESEWQKGFDKFELEKNTWKNNFSRELLEKEAKWEDQYTAFLASKQEWLYRQYVYAENAASFELMENSGLSVDEEIKKSLVQMESGILADANFEAIKKNTEDFISGLYSTSLLGKINAGLGLISESALDLNFTVQNKNYYDGHSANALVLALEGQKDISEKMKTNAAHLASLQAEERIEKITAGLLERLEKENAAQEDYFLALFADSGYTLGDEMTRTITTDSSLLETKVDTQIVEKYKPFVAPTLPESGVRITSADNEKSLMEKTSLALENLSRWEKQVFGESVEDENGSLRAKYRTIARSVADAASSGNTSSYDESEIKVKESLERFNVLKEKLEQTTPDMDDFMATVAELQSLETDTVTVRDGAFGEYLGYSSRFKENPDVKKGMAANIEQKGRGEAGRLWDAYNWNEMVRRFGMGELNKSLYDKKLFVSDGFFQAPTIRELTDLAANIASVATGGSLAPLIALADDAVFGLLDASLGYKDWGNVALDFTKAAVGTGISMGVGALSGVLGGVVDGLDSAAYSALDKLIFKTEIASGTALLSSGSNALLNGLQYDYENKSWTYDDALALSALSSPSVLAASLGAGVNVFVGGGLREITSYDGLNRNLNSSLFNTNGINQFNTFIASLTSTSLEYLLTGETTLNLLNIADFSQYTGLNSSIRKGLLEFNLGKNGFSGKIGTGGLDISPSNLMLSLSGANDSLKIVAAKTLSLFGNNNDIATLNTVNALSNTGSLSDLEIAENVWNNTIKVKYIDFENGALGRADRDNNTIYITNRFVENTDDSAASLGSMLSHEYGHLCGRDEFNARVEGYKTYSLLKNQLNVNEETFMDFSDIAYLTNIYNEGGEEALFTNLFFGDVFDADNLSSDYYLAKINDIGWRQNEEQHRPVLIGDSLTEDDANTYNKGLMEKMFLEYKNKVYSEYFDSLENKESAISFEDYDDYKYSNLEDFFEKEKNKYYIGKNWDILKATTESIRDVGCTLATACYIAYSVTGKLFSFAEANAKLTDNGVFLNYWAEDSEGKWIVSDGNQKKYLRRGNNYVLAVNTLAGDDVLEYVYSQNENLKQYLYEVKTDPSDLYYIHARTNTENHDKDKNYHSILINDMKLDAGKQDLSLPEGEDLSWYYSDEVTIFDPWRNEKNDRRFDEIGRMDFYRLTNTGKCLKYINEGEVYELLSLTSKSILEKYHLPDFTGSFSRPFCK